MRMKNIKSLVAGVLVCVVAFGTSGCARSEMQELFPEEIYQTNLDEYSAAMSKEEYEEGEFPDVKEEEMKEYYQNGGYKAGTDDPAVLDLGIYTGFYYGYYDIDENGIDELMIGYGSEDMNTGSSAIDIVDIYGIRHNKAVKPADMQDFAGDVSGENVGTGDQLLDKMNAQRTEMDIRWHIIDPVWRTEMTDVPIVCPDIYMNGNNTPSGRIVVEEKEPGITTVCMMAYRYFSSFRPEVIFSGVGYITKDGLLVNISGRQVRIRQKDPGVDNFQFVLEVAPSLRKEWGLDVHIIDNVYVSTSR